MTGGPKLYERRKVGRPPKDQSMTAALAIVEVRDNPTTRDNPILSLIMAARFCHAKRRNGPATAYLEAAEYLVSACQTAAQLDLFQNPMETCSCGHSHAEHIDGNYCRSCLYKLNGLGWHGCKAFTPIAAVHVVPERWRCACGRTWADRTDKDYQEPGHPRFHTREKGKSCYELKPQGVKGRMIRVILAHVDGLQCEKIL